MSAAADALMGIFGFKRVESEMKTIEQTRRELFQKYMADNHPSIGIRCYGEAQGCTGCNDFEDDVASAMYGAFNAALDAVVIELPDSYADAPRYACYEGGWNDMRGETVDAIESTNLGLKII